MADSADELILSMQHLAAQARATMDASAARAGLDRLKSAAQKMAWQSQKDVTALEKTQEHAEARLEELRKDGVTPDEAPEFVKVHAELKDAEKKLVKARAQLNFALDRMSDVERREYDAFHAEVRAGTHAQLADDVRSNRSP